MMSSDGACERLPIPAGTVLFILPDRQAARRLGVSPGRSVLIWSAPGQMESRCAVTSAPKHPPVSGMILGDVDFHAGAQVKVDAMIARAKERAAKAKRPSGAHQN